MDRTDRFKKVMDILDKNDLSNCCKSHMIFDQLKDEELDDEEKIKEVADIIRAYEDRVENNPSKYPEYIMAYLRQRRGLSEYDASKDEKLSNMQPSEVFAEVCNWNGLVNYDTTIKDWIKDIYGIEIE